MDILIRIKRLVIARRVLLTGLALYTKGKILQKEGVDFFYVLISSKRSTD